MAMLLRQRNLIWRVCRGFSLGKAWTVEDMMQEVFIALWRSRRHFRGDCSESTWVYSVAVKTLCALCRKHSNRPAPIEDTVPEPATVDSGEWHLRMFIDSLGEPDSLILNAHLDGFDNDKIAEMTGLSMAAVASRIYRGKQQIRKEYEERL